MSQSTEQVAHLIIIFIITIFFYSLFRNFIKKENYTIKTNK